MAKNLMTDELNRRLVAALQKEGRISHAELAERLNVSRPTVIDRPTTTARFPAIGTPVE